MGVVYIEEEDDHVHRLVVEGHVSGAKEALKSEIRRAVFWRQDSENNALVKPARTANSRDAIIQHSRGQESR